MNSFFASCEQQTNYWLRGRPVAVCVYTGKYGCIIAPSIEAKKRGIKLGMRLDEAMSICPELVPLETNPARYREIHNKLITVLRKYANEVIPKSIDEALIDFSSYKYIYKDLTVVAKKIKEDIRKEVGDWLQCSIGIAPNAFLAKLGTEIQKPNGLVVIDEKNIDEILQKLSLTDLPGIGVGMRERLEKSGIHTPMQLRKASADFLKIACKSIVGYYWNQRLNFQETSTDAEMRPYKTMQAMRMIASSQRKPEQLNEILQTLCMTLERRLVKHEVHAKSYFMFIKYQDNYKWKDKIQLIQPLQDGIKLLSIFRKRTEEFQKLNNLTEPLINSNITALGVGVADFIASDALNYHLFEDNVREDILRKSVYDIKNKHGMDKIFRASELIDTPVLKDVIGFGSVKDIYDFSGEEML